VPWASQLLEVMDKEALLPAVLTRMFIGYFLFNSSISFLSRL